MWLQLWDDSKSKKTINADIPISLYILQNNINNLRKNTEIHSLIQRDKLNITTTRYISNKYSIPLAYQSIGIKLIKFIEAKNCSLKVKTKTIKSVGIKTKIPAEYKLEDGFAIDTYTLKDGPLIKKAIEHHPDADKDKIIIANKRGFKGAFIDRGKLSLTGNHKFYILGENLEVMLELLNLKIIHIVGNYFKYGQSFLDKEAFEYIPDIRKLGYTTITKNEFYELIKLTQHEIDFIENPTNNMSNKIISKKVTRKSKKNKVTKLKLK